MARRRRHRRHAHHRQGILHKALLPASFTAAFIQQITAKDVQTAQANGSWNNMGYTDKAKFVGNSVVGNTFGFNSLNVAGIANKWVGLGAVMSFALPMIPKLPFKSQMRKAGAGFLLGGILGGLLDAPARSGGTQSRTTQYSQYSSNTLTNRSTSNQYSI